MLDPVLKLYKNETRKWTRYIQEDLSNEIGDYRVINSILELSSYPASKETV